MQEPSSASDYESVLFGVDNPPGEQAWAQVLSSETAAIRDAPTAT